MPRRMVAAVISVVLAVVLASCSNHSAGPGTGSTSASSAAPPTPSVAGVSTSSASSASTSAVASSAQAALNPWPSSLTPTQVADAQAALDVYGRYQALVGVAGADPGRDWTAEISWSLPR